MWSENICFTYFLLYFFSKLDRQCTSHVCIRVRFIIITPNYDTYHTMLDVVEYNLCMAGYNLRRMDGSMSIKASGVVINILFHRLKGDYLIDDDFIANNNSKKDNITSISTVLTLISSYTEDDYVEWMYNKNIAVLFAMSTIVQTGNWFHYSQQALGSITIVGSIIDMNACFFRPWWPSSPF